MNKNILYSIRPEWCQQIANGTKILEIRKSAPKLNNLPCKAYIYCTLGDPKTNYMLGKRGKVIGEFTLREYDILKYISLNNEEPFYFNIMTHGDKDCWKNHCGTITLEQIREYGQGKTLYLIKIEDLIIYDEPVELTEFGTKEMIYDPSSQQYKECFVSLGNPPQSWCYVERRNYE